MKLRAHVDGCAIDRRYVYEQPLRSEIFNLKQLERHARTLAKWHEVDPRPGDDRLLSRLNENEKVLLEVYGLLTEAAEVRGRIAPAGDWLLDNFYRIEEEMRLARRHLPRKYSVQLPRLLKGPQAGYPRVYDVARELVLHLDGRLDESSLGRFLASYQRVRILRLGELWAVPIMLRLALIENLRRISSRVASSWLDKNLAATWADRLLEVSESDPREMIQAVADLDRSNPPLSSAFVAEMARRLQGQSPVLSLPLAWLEGRLSEAGTSTEKLIQEEVQQEAADKVSVGNSIESFRFIDSLQWNRFVEEQSLVEAALARDPAKVYSEMDFSTRDRYRHTVEALAKHSPFTEEEVAHVAVALASNAAFTRGNSDRSAHVGYYLVDEGKADLERAIQIKPLKRRFLLRSRLLLYIGSIAFITLLITFSLLAYARSQGDGGWPLALAGLLLAFISSSLAISLVNWAVTLLIKPCVLPRMDFSKGIPQDYITMVVVPALLTSIEGAQELVRGLEVRFLANGDENLYFGLLTDLKDAQEEFTPKDGELVQVVRDGVEALNTKYPGARFYLFHRPRRWNPQEKAWIGYERKRGAIEELNSYLKGKAEGRFSLVIGDASVLQRVKYVITLDSDTQIPRGHARKLVETITHPINRPVYDQATGCILQGYSILQPRLAVSLPEANRSRFARVFVGEAGLDPYTREVSDIYQDLFQEGSFTGKGIYDVDAFSKVLAGKFPENLILSHDLLEGCYARAALVSDIQFYESFPYSYIADVGRRHRWIRGDWQIAWWLFSRVPGPKFQMVENPISGLSRWKILDNLRRSLVPLAQVLLLVLGWSVLNAHIFWTSAVVGILLVVPILALIVDSLPSGSELPLSLRLRSQAKSLYQNLKQVGLALTFLPYEAYFSLDALLKSWFRMAITRRRLLEWRTSRDSERCSCNSLSGFYASMWISVALALALALALASGLYLGLWQQSALTVAAPFLIIWLLSPLLAWWISRPSVPSRSKLDSDQEVFLRKLSRRIWFFFETFVGPDNNWLPPDNYQEEPLSVVANGTSPTNIGLSLLSTLAAYDFGYVSAGGMLDRLERSFRSMEKLDKFHGHLYNWYDTKRLCPLCPLYISTVDSGNLIGHLAILRWGILELPDREIIHQRSLIGLQDTLLLLLEESRKAASDRGVSLPEDTVQKIDALLAGAQSPSRSPYEIWDLLSRQASEAASISAGLGDAGGDLWQWFELFQGQIRSYLDDLSILVPWARLELEGEIPVEIRRELDCLGMPTLRDVACLQSRLEGSLGSHKSNLPSWIVQASARANERLDAIDALAERCREMSEVEFGFLFDEFRNLLSIGYNVSELARDSSCYDLLASEARLASFYGISQGKLPQEHWFSLGRQLTTAGGELALLSWGGTMFEYLMPLLVMPTYENTLLDQTCRAVVRRQAEYGRLRGIPWGVSESGFNLADANQIYQYRAFGVPGLGFKRGLVEDLVVAPYASVLALMVDPDEASSNLQRMADDGYMGDYGFYEAIDFTPSRVPPGKDRAIVRSYMAHHQGMSFLSLAYLLLDLPMQRRFNLEPAFQATELLLQEKVPKVAPFYPHAAELLGPLWRATPKEALGIIRFFDDPNTPEPEVHLLSNGRYNVMVTNAAGGYSTWNGLAVTRWRRDATRDNDGIYVYIRDVESGEFWSAGYQPTLIEPESFEAAFRNSRGEFRRRDRGVDTHMQVTVSPEDDVEVRTVAITNRTRARRIIEVTSYAEVVMNSPAADASHPAFSNLFMETYVLSNLNAILCHRRPRSAEESNPWMLHLVAVEGELSGSISYEVDRYRFLGRGRSTLDPRAMSEPDLSGGGEPALDPIVSIRCKVGLEPGETARVSFYIGVGESRSAAEELVEKYRDAHMVDRVFDLAWSRGQVILQQLNANESDIQLYERLASGLIYTRSEWRASPGVIASNMLGQPGLWAYGISGDYPIVLLRIGGRSGLDILRQLLKAHAYWRLSGLAVDLVVWNEDRSGYRQAFQDEIIGLIGTSSEASNLDKPGGVFVRKADQISPEAKVLMQSVAAAIFAGDRGSLKEQIGRKAPPKIRVPYLNPSWVAEEIRDVDTIDGRQEAVIEEEVSEEIIEEEMQEARAAPRGDLVFFNGLGGFTQDGREYIITLAPGQASPEPWSNVIANSNFGTVVSDGGPVYTWSENSQLFRLTPWYNDPVTDQGGEALYLRDEDSGRFWSLTPLPSRGGTPYTVRHGFGYSVFEHIEDGLKAELWIYAASDAPVKFSVVRVKNESGRGRRLSATFFAELVLGDLRSKNSSQVITEVDSHTGALFIRNPYNADFPGRVAFLDVNSESRTFTGDRAEFLGRNGHPSSPLAMSRTRLSNRAGAALDPCAALQVQFDLAEGQEAEVVFTFGSGRDAIEARSLVARFRGSGPARQALESVWKYWNRTLGVVYLETPDRSLDILANGWLIYQVLSSRIWARTGYYQSSGAFGFRDQLQDVMALLNAEPRIARDQILLSSAHQFVEGDVQHWWHEPTGRGIRTQISDDYLWLPWSVAQYIKATGDRSILRESIGFLVGRPLNPGEESYYDLPGISPESGTLYEHCVRAIRYGLKFGPHGLPLMGSGDWNDGMNRVGYQGIGESVWLAFFLHQVLVSFSVIAQIMEDNTFAELCISEASGLLQKIEENGWDGQWYLRAYFDNGEPLGSEKNAECKIDSLPQSWSALTGAGDPERSRIAMESADRLLVKRDMRIIQLLDPPFDAGGLDPGYIKGYIPGVRENGGQYSHAAMWVVMAFAALGDIHRSWELLALINPLKHGSTPEEVDVYRVEPYVVAGDIYSQPPHAGRGGWTWYTGAAGWMYRLIVESLLGLKLEADVLKFAPLMPTKWDSFKVHYRYIDTFYHINFLRAGPGKAVDSVSLDGADLPEKHLMLVDDRRDHQVEVRIG